MSGDVTSTSHSPRCTTTLPSAHPQPSPQTCPRPHPTCAMERGALTTSYVSDLSSFTTPVRGVSFGNLPLVSARTATSRPTSSSGLRPLARARPTPLALTADEVRQSVGIVRSVGGLRPAGVGVHVFWGTLCLAVRLAETWVFHQLFRAFRLPVASWHAPPALSPGPVPRLVFATEIEIGINNTGWGLRSWGLEARGPNRNTFVCVYDLRVCLFWTCEFPVLWARLWVQPLAS